jgi:hypothetical protein
VLLCWNFLINSRIKDDKETSSRLILKHRTATANMANAFRQRLTSIKDGAKEKTKPAGWIIPRQKSTFGDEDSW